MVLFISGFIAACLFADSLSAMQWSAVYSPIYVPDFTESPCNDATKALGVEIPSARHIIRDLASDVSSIFEFDQWSRFGIEYMRYEPILPLQHFSGRSELPVVETFEWILRQTRYNSADALTLVLDVGANAGFFSSMAGLLGYRVFAFEPQPSCLPWIAIHAHRNRVSDRVCIVNAGIDNRTDDSGKYISVDSFGGCNPVYVALDHIRQRSESEALKHRMQVPVLSLAPLCSMIIRREMIVPVVKIDTEGAEIGVLESLDSALRTHRIRNLLVELAPGVWASRDPEHGITRGHATLHRLIVEYGYLFKVFDDGDNHSTKVIGESPFGNTTLSHVKWYDVPDLWAYLTELAHAGQGDNVLFTLDAVLS